MADAFPTEVKPGALPAGLEQSPDGIWYARQRGSVSYPEEGNANCLALEEDSFWFEHRSRCILALMRRYPPGGTLFDVGGGNGYVAMSLQRAGITTALVEPGAVGARNARRRGVDTVICAALQDAGFPAGSLPAVGLFDVLEHITDDGAFLQDLRARLVPGGRLYLTVPAYRWLWSADDDYAGHIRRYTLTGLFRTLRAQGFVPEFGSYLFWMLPPPIFLSRALPTRLGLRKGNEWARYHQEHNARSGLVGRLLERLLALDLGQIARGRSVPVGGSCLVVAKRV
jgi:SAM-dependent methyltransferase